MSCFPRISLFTLSLVAWVSPVRGASDEAAALAIRSAREAYASADLRGDVAAMAKIYAPDAEIDPPGEPPVFGRESVRIRLRRFREARPPIERERFDAASLDVCEDLAVESGTWSADERMSDGTVTTTRGLRLAVWKRQAEGSWRIRQEMWGGESPSRSALPAAPIAVSPAPSSAPAATAAEAPSGETLSIPEPRSLSDGFVRAVADQLRSRAAKIRALESSEEARRVAVARADRELRKIVRDVGWIDVERFGTAASCDAAFIVAASGDPAFIRATVPLMQDLRTNRASSGCYQPAIDAYEKIAPK